MPGPCQVQACLPCPAGCGLLKALRTLQNGRLLLMQALDIEAALEPVSWLSGQSCCLAIAKPACELNTT